MMDKAFILIASVALLVVALAIAVDVVFRHMVCV